MSCLRPIVRWGAILGWLVAGPTHGLTLSDADWRVQINLPDQDYNSNTSSADEYAIRNGLLLQVLLLNAGDTGTLATFTFSGSLTCCGFAGPLLEQMEGALNRGATVRFIADSYVSATTLYGGRSLQGLASRAVNPLVLVEDDSSFGIHHNKLGLFDYGAGERVVTVGSANFSSSSQTAQWNIGLELENDAVFDAFQSEVTELLAGRFHDHASKSHAHNGTVFALEDSWGMCSVRFGPHPDDTDGGNNAAAEMATLIDAAAEEIVFAVAHLTSFTVRDALVRAADRGVAIHGAVPLANVTGDGFSRVTYEYLTDSGTYATTNQVQFATVFSDGDQTLLDDGSFSELIHTKYMVIDAWNDRPVLVHGSANFSYSALQSESSNDENILFLRHRELARVFYAHFKRATGLWQQRDDFWWVTREIGDGLELWTTDEGSYQLESTTGVTPLNWLPTGAPVTGAIGKAAVLPVSGGTTLYRARRP